MKNITIPNWLALGILFIVATLFVFLFSSTTSPLYEHYPFWFHGDSGIFQEMGVCLLQGGTPYVELFDHKGPILWFIQALGIWISPKWGLAVLQSVSLFITLLLLYKSASLLIDKQLISIIITVSSLLFLLAFYQRGNLCEEWCLPFISLPIYLFSKRLKTNDDKNRIIYNHKDAFVIGLCVGAISMIRLNNTAPIIGFVLWHFVLCIQQKEFRRIWIDIILICCGMAIIIILCSLFYLVKAGWNGVHEMIYGTFIFNFIYINGSGDVSTVTKLQNYAPSILFTIITIIIIAGKKETTNIIIAVLISYIVTLLSIGIIGYIHYMMIFIPLFVITICLIVITKSKWSYIIMGVAIFYSFFLGYDAADHLLFILRGKKANTELNDGFHRFVSSLQNDEDKSIYNAGLNNMGAGLFADENIYQCNRMISNNHLKYSDHLRKYDTFHGIKDLQPIWVLTQSPRPEITDEYMKTHYTLADSIPGGEFDPIWCWKRNDELYSLESRK